HVGQAQAGHVEIGDVPRVGQVVNGRHGRGGDVTQVEGVQVGHAFQKSNVGYQSVVQRQPGNLRHVREKVHLRQRIAAEVEHVKGGHSKKDIRAGDLVSAGIKPVEVRDGGGGTEVRDQVLGDIQLEHRLQPGHEGNIGDVVSVDVEVREVAEGGQNGDVRGVVVLHAQGGEGGQQVGHRRNIGELIAVNFQVPKVRQAGQETQVGDAAVVQEQLLQHRQATEQVGVGDRIVVEVQVIQVGGQIKPLHAGDALVFQRQGGQAGQVRLQNPARRNSNGGAHGRLQPGVGENHGQVNTQLRGVAVDLPVVIGNDGKVSASVGSRHVGDRERGGESAADAAVGRISQGIVVEIPLVVDV